MELLDTLFDNVFFRLPVLEAMMWVALVLSIGAGFVGLWQPFTFRSASAASAASRSYDSPYQPLGKAA